MQTDCPTEDMRDRKMKRNNRGRMRGVTVSRKTSLHKKSYLTQGTQNLPHLKARGKRYAQGQRRRREDTTEREAS